MLALFRRVRARLAFRTADYALALMLALTAFAVTCRACGKAP